VDCATPAANRKLREWQIGVALFSVGNVANFVSFGAQHNNNNNGQQ
jgi:hypothetical protein